MKNKYFPMVQRKFSNLDDNFRRYYMFEMDSIHLYSDRINLFELSVVLCRNYRWHNQCLKAQHNFRKLDSRQHKVLFIINNICNCKCMIHLMVMN